MPNSVYPDETAHMSRLIWIYAVCKSLLLSPVVVKELNANFLFDKIASLNGTSNLIICKKREIY